jgi:hypothetical protein
MSDRGDKVTVLPSGAQRIARAGVVTAVYSTSVSVRHLDACAECIVDDWAHAGSVGHYTKSRVVREESRDE